MILNKNEKDELIILGKVLREFRLKTGLSQEKLADKASLHRTYIGGIERAERNPSFISLHRILISLDIDWEDLGTNLQMKFNTKR